MISIIIVTYNSERFIPRCLNSLLEHKIDYEPEIIIVDNASTDKSVEIIKRSYLQVKLIKNKTNAGFTKACNQGVEIAKGDYVLFLNPDTEIVGTNFFKKLLRFAKHKKNFGAIGPRFLNSDRTLQPSVGKFPTLLKVIIDRIKFLNTFVDGILIRKTFFYIKPSKVDWICAGCLLIKRNIFDEVGGFNEDIFMYGEDFDLCYRMKKKNYKNYFFPDVEIIHHDTGKNNPLRKPHKYFSMRKGLLFFLKNHRTKLSYLLFLYLIKIESLVRLIFLTFKKFKNNKEKKLWQNYIIKSINLKV